MSELKEKIINSKTSIKNLLLNQSVVSGLGNIYVNEVLYLCKINPKRYGYSIKDYEIKNLVKSIKKILKNAIKAGGSTISNYHNSEGKIGSYQSNFKVYGQEGANCHRSRCGGKIKRIFHSGRSIFFCSSCQT